MTNASKLDAQIWAEFNNRWDELAFESERLITALQGEVHLPVGREEFATACRRVNQNFFRQAVLAAYNNACCMTGLSNAELLVAGHIKPWAVSTAAEKTNPANGLCLNALHDKAFDRGFITVTPDYKIHVSADISDTCDGMTVEKFFAACNGKTIALPEKFAPHKEFLTYHNDVVFEHWR